MLEEKLARGLVAIRMNCSDTCSRLRVLGLMSEGGWIFGGIDGRKDEC